MKKRILILLLVISILPSAAYAEAGYFQNELDVVDALLNECDGKNIETPYEDMGFQVLKRFSEYFAEDELEGVDEAQLSYNKSYMEKLYSEITENLNLYLNGKKPLTVMPYDMSEFENFQSDGRSVYSVGYGHGQAVCDDIENMQLFGATNIQIETGPARILTEVPGFTKKGNLFSCSVEDDYLSLKSDSGDGSIELKQSVRVTPNTTYTFGFKTKASLGSGKFTISFGGISNTYTSSDLPYSWTNQEFSYTTGDEEELDFCITAQNAVSVLYIDELYVRDADGNNLLYNGSFDDKYDKKEIDELKRDLERAYENNVTVSLLLSPHYFPTYLDVEGLYNFDAGSLIKYNISMPEAKTVIEEYLNILLPEIKDCKAVSSICLTNEPVFETRNWYSYYAPEFCKWLEEKYVSIEALNVAYGANYGSFEEVEMPSAAASEGSARHYDYLRFNDEVVTLWHGWMADIVKKHLPDMPVHVKTLRTINTSNLYGSIRHGANPEDFDAFCDWAGNDAYSYNNHGGQGDYTTDDFYKKMMWYDYLWSVTGKPVYNSEDHVLQNGFTDFDEHFAKNIGADIWQGALHNRKMSTVWVWGRSYNPENHLYNSVLHRPDCVYEIGKRALDLTRLSRDIDRITSKKPKVALFYSEATRNYGGAENHLESMTKAYKELLSMGQPVGFVTENSLERISEYEILVVPGVTHTIPETVLSIEDYIMTGGTVIEYTESFVKDEYNKISDYKPDGMITADDNTLREMLQNVLNDKGLLRVKLVDNATGELAENVDWSYSLNGDDIVVNILAHDEEKNVSVYVDGVKRENLINALDNSLFTGSIKPLEPIFLKKAYTQIKSGVVIKNVSGKTVTWTCDDEAYAGANIYRVKDGKLELAGKVYGFSYTADADDSALIIKAIDALGNESYGVSTGVNENPEISAYIVGDTAYVENTTDTVQAGVLSVAAKDKVTGAIKKRSQVSYMLNPYQKVSMKIMISADSGEELSVSVSNSLND